MFPMLRWYAEGTGYLRFREDTQFAVRSYAYEIFGHLFEEDGFWPTVDQTPPSLLESDFAIFYCASIA